MFTSIIRTGILYTVVVIALRVMGKRQVGELEPSELVVAIMISELAAVPMQDFSIPIIHGVVPILVLMSLELLLSVGLIKSIRFRKLLCGKPSLVIENGKILQYELRRNRVTIDELVEELRLLGYLDISRVQYAILETSGKLSIVPYAEHQAATAGDVAKAASQPVAASPGLPVMLISDGHWLSNNIRLRGIKMDWLQNQLRALGASSAKDVFLLTVDDRDQLYYLPKESRR